MVVVNLNGINNFCFTLFFHVTAVYDLGSNPTILCLPAWPNDEKKFEGVSERSALDFMKNPRSVVEERKDEKVEISAHQA